MKRLITIAGIDEGKGVRLVYFYDSNGKVTTTDTRLPYNGSTESISPDYPSAEFYEREIHDFFGITFTGCPNINKRLFKAEGDKKKPFLGARK
ncbi:MAG: NADH-quinone oxidoreductase subunit C [Candidatus Diapherotrites archaeon]|nr:NADH-quinone oxidoreductase subunit C [Candidatus Diapherotrites archaeon]